MANKKPTFENCIIEINSEIIKRKNKWNLTAINWMDFNDVSQILRIHIYKKWHLYDSKKPLAPWVNRIISNQIKNLIRNNYGNYSAQIGAFAQGSSASVSITFNTFEFSNFLYPATSTEISGSDQAFSFQLYPA